MEQQEKVHVPKRKIVMLDLIMVEMAGLLRNWAYDTAKTAIASMGSDPQPTHHRDQI